jgi:glycerophosphoryl diester phosphodiesterase
MKLPLIIGHRGASVVAPENTMAAFRQALAVGADGIEFDVRLTRDLVPVVIHDSTLRRTGRLPDRVVDLTSEEIVKVDVGSWFGRQFAGETVPSLADLFGLFQSNESILYLEMKCDAISEYRPLAEACARLIDAYSLQERVVVECFQLQALTILKEIDPQIKTVALFEPAFANPAMFVAKAKEVGAAAIALHHRLARESLVRKAKDEGLHVAVWTVDDPVWIEKARAMGVDALITNDPRAMLIARGA